MRLTKDTKSYIEELFYDEPDNIDVIVKSKLGVITVDVDSFVSKYQIDKMAQLGLEFKQAQIRPMGLRCYFTKIKKPRHQFPSVRTP